MLKDLCLIHFAMANAFAEVPAAAWLWRRRSLLQALAEAAAEEGELLAAAEQCSAGAARREASRQQTEAEVARLTSVRCALGFLCAVDTDAYAGDAPPYYGKHALVVEAHGNAKVPWRA